MSGLSSMTLMISWQRSPAGRAPVEVDALIRFQRTALLILRTTLPVLDVNGMIHGTKRVELTVDPSLRRVSVAG